MAQWLSGPLRHRGFGLSYSDMNGLVIPVSVRRPWLDRLSSDTVVTAAQFLLLLLALNLNRKLTDSHPAWWIGVPLVVAAALARVRFRETHRSVIRLWQLVGCLSALYSLFHYPLMPLVDDEVTTAGVYGLVLFAWVLSVASGVLCFRIPSVSILPPAFLLWVNLVAERITGLRTTTHLDVQPLTEVSVCIGLGLLVNQLYLLWNSRARGRLATERTAALLSEPGAGGGFEGLLLLVAVGVHLANYYWSFYAKMTLSGPVGAWLRENNPAYIFLAALDDGHIVFADYPRLVAWLYASFDAAHLYSNFFILLFQAAALVAFFMSKRGLLALLLMFDVMHAAIILIAGANFWPWIMLNVIIAVVVAGCRLERQPVALRLAATGFILLAPHFIKVAMLGWYDSGANNKLYFEAVDRSGRHYNVPTNFFTFYSYSFGHMDYGSPEPASAFAIGSPNGSAQTYALFKAGRRCDVASLTQHSHLNEFDPGDLATFVRNYHRLALSIYSKLGVFPYDLYPHHFYVRSAADSDFYNLDKRDIVSYVYRRESVCLSYADGGLQRKMISAAQFTIDLEGATYVGQSGR